MEGELDSRVHFSDASDPWSSSRHVAVLQSLDAVEQVRTYTYLLACLYRSPAPLTHTRLSPSSLLRLLIRNSWQRCAWPPQP